jgi:hypothetical protein
MKLANNIVRINISTAPIYGALEPERRAMTMAAQETLKNGYDRFIVVTGQSDYRPNVIGQTPGYASGSWGPYGGGFTAHGPSTIAMPRFQTEMTIRMFHDGEAGAGNSIDARSVLRQGETQ